MNLYELTGNFLEVQRLIDDGECDNNVLIDTLESLECAIEVKAQNTVYLMKNIEIYSNGLAEEVKRLQAKQKVVDSKLESIKSFLFGQLELVGLTEIKTNICTIRQQNNPPAVNILDESIVPAKYQTIIPETYKISKLDIARDMKAGIEVAGCELKRSKRWVIK